MAVMLTCLAGASGNDLLSHREPSGEGFLNVVPDQLEVIIAPE
jgi:hypothetical protein